MTLTKTGVSGKEIKVKFGRYKGMSVAKDNIPGITAQASTVSDTMAMCVTLSATQDLASNGHCGRCIIL